MITAVKMASAVSAFSSGLISRVLSFSKYALNFIQLDSINAFCLWIQFFSIETPALDHVADGALVDVEFFGGFGCGDGLGHARNIR